jgi:predicted RNA-binding Zn-ribbon protein involved in translation (DUF1610 family)
MESAVATRSTQVLQMQPRETFELEISAARAQRQIQNRMEILKFIGECLVEGTDYGKIPGCGEKPTLLQPGAQKICSLVNVYPDPTVDIRELEDEHREYVVTTHLRHIGTDYVVAKGAGSCSTKESKYRYRSASRVCPQCGKETIIKGKEEFGGGWICFAKKGGCGAKWPNGSAEIEAQAVGQSENKDLADSYNTCLKIAVKRSNIAAALNLSGGWSEHFTQDLEDLRQNESARRGADPEADNAAPAGMENQKDQMQPKALDQRKNCADLIQVLVDEAEVRDSDQEKPLIKALLGIWQVLCEEAGLPKAPEKMPAARFPAMYERWGSACRDYIAQKRAKAGLDPQPKSRTEVRDAEFAVLKNVPFVVSLGEGSHDYLVEKWKDVCHELVLGTYNPEELSNEELESALQGLNRLVSHDDKALQSTKSEPAAGTKKKRS